MLILLGGVYDTSEALILYTEVYNCAHTIPASASSYAVRSNGATILSYDEIQLMESEIWADIPELRSGGKASSATSVTLTAVSFGIDPNQSPATCKSTAQTTTYFLITGSCTYIATQIWSVAYHPPATVSTPSTFINELRECAATTQISPTGPNPTSPLTTYLDTLPVANLSTTNALIPGTFYNPTYSLETGPTPILVTDVQFTYKPGFSFIFNGNVSFWVLGLWPVRNVLTEYPLVYNSTSGIWVTAGNYPSGIVAGNNYWVSQPLQQQFTELYGLEVQAGSAQAITALADFTYTAPNPPFGTNNAANGSTADGPTTNSAWCANVWAANPPPLTLSNDSGVSF
jgi:hypothetical protein